MKKFTLALSAFMMLGATAVAQEAETPVAKKLICTANFDAGAIQAGNRHYLGVDTEGKVIMTNTIDDTSEWIISEPDENGGVKVQNVELEEYLFTNGTGGLYVTPDAPAVYFIDSPKINHAIGITTTRGASTAEQVFVNINGATGNIGLYELDRGSSFFIVDYVEGDTDETVQQRVQAMLARIDGIAAFEKYCDASTSGRNYKNTFLTILESTPDSGFASALANFTEVAISYFITDLQMNVSIKSQASGKYISAPAAAGQDITLSTAAFNLNSDFWYATDLSGTIGWTCKAADCAFKIQNVANGLYIGKQAENAGKVPATANAEEAAVFKVVAGNNGLELIITNAAGDDGNPKANNFINANQNTNMLNVWQAENDPNAFWVIESLSGLSYSQVGAEITGEYEEIKDDDGKTIDKIWSKIDGFSILVPRGATPTGFGSIMFGITGGDKEHMAAIFNKPVAEALNGITPVAGTKTYSDFIENGVDEYGFPKWEEVKITVDVDVYTITLPEAQTAPAEYVVEVSPNAFSVNVTEGETTTTKYTPEIRETVLIPSEKFNIAVAPEAGKVDEIVDITLSMGADDADNSGDDGGIALLADEADSFDINPAYVGENITLTREWPAPLMEDGKPVIDPDMGQIMTTESETILSLDAQAITEFFSYNDEDPTSPVFTLPVNKKDSGDYTLIIPEGFFADNNGALNNFVRVDWTIEVKDGISTITNVSVEGNNIFDLQGRKVAKASKGVFIINGKKVLVK